MVKTSLDIQPADSFSNGFNARILGLEDKLDRVRAGYLRRK
jgi:hypothetical protein